MMGRTLPVGGRVLGRFPRFSSSLDTWLQLLRSPELQDNKRVAACLRFGPHSPIEDLGRRLRRAEMHSRTLSHVLRSVERTGAGSKPTVLKSTILHSNLVTLQGYESVAG